MVGRPSANHRAVDKEHIAGGMPFLRCRLWRERGSRKERDSAAW